MESGVSKNEIIIDDKEYFITERLIKKLKWRNNIIFLEVIILGIIYSRLLDNGLREIIYNKFIIAILFLVVGMIIVLFTSSKILGKDIEKEIIPKDNR